MQQPVQTGTMDWMGIWFPGQGSGVECDFSAMISPAMFEEFVLPDLQEQCRRLEHSIYHWDGPGQLPHLDLLLSIPELDAIQWTPGAGNPGPGSPKWFPLYRRIQEAGKGVVLLGIAPEDIEGVMGELSPKGLLMTTRTETEDQARDLLGNVEKWTPQGSLVACP
jgi:5-methyltetrahydrofolate--homocysteine methyltransferase